MPDQIGVCASCLYWDDELADHRGLGSCRKNAPQPALHLPNYVVGYDSESDDLEDWRNDACGEHNLAIWPRTFNEDWCGDWKSRGIR